MGVFFYLFIKKKILCLFVIYLRTLMVSYGDVVLGRLSKLKGDVVRMNTLYLLIIKKWIYAFMFR